MKNNLEEFENRSKDWLASQREYEEHVSVWDFDEARKIKEEHAKKHARYNTYEKTSDIMLQKSKRITSSPNNKGPKAVVALFIIIWTTVLITILINIITGIF